MKPRWIIMMLAALLLFFNAGRAFTQTITGVISGTVTDPSGQDIPGAVVTLINEGTGDSRPAIADAAGNFVFPAVLP
jgi:hypothetical protein